MSFFYRAAAHVCSARGFILTMMMLGSSLYAFAQDTLREPECMKCACENGNSDAPIGVNIDHIHEKGSWMFSYRYMSMRMQGNRSEGVPLSDDQVYIHYMMSPATMQMDMHMLMGMYSISDRFTAMLMLNYSNSIMSMKMMPTEGMNMPGMQESGNASGMTMHTSGLSDTRLYGMYKLYSAKGQLLILAAGLSLPTGKINLQTPSFSGVYLERASYNMQTGSGTLDFLPSIVYTGKSGKTGWGAAVAGIIRPYNNSNGYRLGNESDATAWFSYHFAKWISSSLRLESIGRERISGYDSQVYQNTEPGADPLNYGGTQLLAHIGTNVYFNHGLLKDQKLGVEYGIPFYQQMNGLQMNTHYIVSAGWQYVF
jgi:hypothetical protein